MSSSIVIRREKSSDIGAILAVPAAVFENPPVSRQSELYIIDALRAAGAFTG